MDHQRKLLSCIYWTWFFCTENLILFDLFTNKALSELWMDFSGYGKFTDIESEQCKNSSCQCNIKKKNLWNLKFRINSFTICNLNMFKHLSLMIILILYSLFLRKVEGSVMPSYIWPLAYIYNRTIPVTPPLIVYGGVTQKNETGLSFDGKTGYIDAGNFEGKLCVSYLPNWCSNEDTRTTSITSFWCLLVNFFL